MSGGQSASVGLMMMNADVAAAISRRRGQRRGAAGGGAADGRRRSCASSTSARSCDDAPAASARASALLAAFFALFVLFLYGPTLTIIILSFQGPTGGLTFPMNGVSLHWFANLFETQAVGDFGGCVPALARARAGGDGGRPCWSRSRPASPSAGASAARRVLFYLTVASLIVPSILISLGIGLLFRVIGRRHRLVQLGVRRASDLDAAVRPADHVRRLQPLRPALRGGGARSRRHLVADRSAMSSCRSSLPSLIGVGLFGFTLCYDEFARTLLTRRAPSTRCRSRSTA